MLAGEPAMYTQMDQALYNSSFIVSDASLWVAFYISEGPPPHALAKWL